MTAKEQARNEAIQNLCSRIKPGDTVYTILRHVSRSRMTRVIDLLINEDGDIHSIAGYAARAMNHPLDRDRWGIKIGGCGMDMGFALVYNLGRTLFLGGFGDIGTGPLGHKIRPTSPEMAAKAREKGYTFRGRNGDPSGWDNDGGHALEHRWL